MLVLALASAAALLTLAWGTYAYYHALHVLGQFPPGALPRHIALQYVGVVYGLASTFPGRLACREVRVWVRIREIATQNGNDLAVLKQCKYTLMHLARDTVTSRAMEPVA